MKPGRELDALVAEHVMLWDRVQKAGTEYWSNDGRIVELAKYDADYNPPDPWSPSTDLRAAGQVIDALAKRDIGIELITLPNQDVECWTLQRTKAERHEAYWQLFAPTIPHAVCLAALKAVGVEIESEGYSSE